jgi:sugar/nucleoside kinase (ribokinase family)
MSILVVGTVAYDTIKTPFGKVERTLGGSATHFSLAASILCNDIKLVGVVGNDFKDQDIDFLKERGVNFDAMVKKEDGKTFFWEGYYEYDMNSAHTVTTELNVLQEFDPVIPEELRDTEFVFLANIDPDIQLKVIDQMRKPKLIVCDTMNFWIENKKEQLLEVLKRVDVVLLNDGEARELFETPVLMKAAKKVLSVI